MIRYLTAGESHGEALIGIVEGLPAGVSITESYINRHLRRRWLGFGRGGRAKFEVDKAHLYSGVRFGLSIGSPISIRLDNAAYKRDKSGWPTVMSTAKISEEVMPDPVTLPRPGHADLVGTQKYGFDDIRPVIERSSARETAMRVACCSIARSFLEQCGITIASHVVKIGEVGYQSASDYERSVAVLLGDGGTRALNDKADSSEVRILDSELSDRAVEHIRQVKKDGDSVGGSYEVIVTGVPVGLGSYVHWDRRLDGQLAQAILSIQAQKAVEIGEGILGATRPGSQIHDEIIGDPSNPGRATNRAGGIEGGVSNGQNIVVRGFMKPIPTLIKPLRTVDIRTGESQETRYERSDVTSVPAASTVAEATVALTIANALLAKFGGDSLNEIVRRIPKTIPSAQDP